MTETETEHEPETTFAPETDDELAEGAESDLAAEPAEGDGPDEEPEEPQGGALSQSDIEKQMAKLEKEATRHANRVAEIMEEAAQELVPCPRCVGPFVGFIFPPDQVQPDEQTRRAVLASIGEEQREDYLRAPNARQCDGCNGLGRVLSGSRVNGQELILCPKCQNGRGWLQVGDDIPARAAGNGDGALAEPVVAPEPLPDTDPWGRRPSDPNYGKLPQYAV